VNFRRRSGEDEATKQIATVARDDLEKQPHLVGPEASAPPC